nr:protein LZIC-like [Leptinotarsa decemlineata]
MTSYGKAETEKLKQNLEGQLDRLVEQLQDLEDCKKELEEEEYEETKNETMEQLKELNDSLNKLVKGDISLVSALGAVQLATQAAISQAFRTPEVIRLFGKKDPKQLRERLLMIEESLRLNTLSIDSRDRQKAEILMALRQLGEQLTTEELKFLESHNDISNAFKNVAFVEVDDD